ARLLVALFLSCVVFSPTNALASWTAIGPETATVLSFARVPGNPARVFAGTYFGGLYRSDDAGISWALLATPFANDSVLAIALAPASPQALYVGTFGHGVARSDDGGASWSVLSQGLTDLTVRDISVDPANSSVVLAATFSGIFRSEDGGVT